VVVITLEVALLIAVMVVFGTTLPLASRTVPTTDPVSSCPKALPAASRTKHALTEILVI
jgi:hypothetical protein